MIDFLKQVFTPSVFAVSGFLFVLPIAIQAIIFRIEDGDWSSLRFFSPWYRE